MDGYHGEWGNKWEITINKNYQIAGMKPCH